MLETLVSGDLSAARTLTLLGVKIVGAEDVLGREIGGRASTESFG